MTRMQRVVSLFMLSLRVPLIEISRPVLYVGITGIFRQVYIPPNYAPEQVVAEE